MDFVTPVLFSLLVILAILVYVRLGNLVNLVKETKDVKSKQGSSTESSNRIRVFVINAKQGTSTNTIIIKNDTAGKHLQSGIKSSSIKRVLINGGAFEVTVEEESSRDGFVLKLVPCGDKSPFPLDNNSETSKFGDVFKQYYCMCF